MEAAAPQVQSLGSAPPLAATGYGGDTEGGGSQTVFSSAGPLPPVAAAGAAAGPPPSSPSELAFGDGNGMPKIELVGTDPDDTPAPNGTVGLDQDLATPRSELAAHGQALPPQGGAEDIQGNPQLVQPPPAAAPADDGPPPSPELVASIQQAQADAKAATDEANAEAQAYTAGMQDQQNRFEDAQRAAMVEQLKVMSPGDKRAMLKDLGYPAQDIPKLTDAELDQVIEDKYDANARKTKILGMAPDQLAALTQAQKAQFLVDIGIDKGDVDHIGPAKAAQAFDQIMQVAHVDGTHQVKIKISGGWFSSKSWQVTVKCDNGVPDISVEKQGGFMSKLWGWLKLALPVVLTILGPLTAGVSLIVLAVYQAVTAIASGNWLGAVIGIAGALTGAGLFAVAHGLAGAASGFEKLAAVAQKVKDVATAAQSALKAEKAKNPGSLLGALADGASAFAGFSSNSADKFAQTMTSWSKKLKQWDAIVSGGQQVVTAVKGNDPIAALAGALNTAAAVTGPGAGATAELQKASTIATYVDAGKKALGGKPPDYGAVVAAALGIAGQLSANGRVADAAKITAQANALQKAIAGNDAAAIAAAGLGLAEAIQVAKWDADNKDRADAAAPTTSIAQRYQLANEIVSTASKVLLATRAKPRPDYLAVTGAITQLTSDLSDSQQPDKAATLLRLFDTWTGAINSNDEGAIFNAGAALGNAIDSMRGDLDQEHDDARQAVQKDGGSAPDAAADDAGELAADPGPTEPLASTPLTGIAMTPTLPAQDGDATDPGGPTIGPGGPTIGPAPAPAPDPDSYAGPSADEKPVVDRNVTIIKVFAAVAEAFGQDAPKKAIDEWEALADEYEAFSKDGHASGAAYQQVVKSLLVLDATTDVFFERCAEEVDSYQGALGALDQTQVAGALGRYTALLGALGKIAGVAGTVGALLDAANNLLVVCGYDSSGKPVGVEARLKAAADLAEELAGLPGHLAWAVQTVAKARALLVNSATADAAIDLVKAAVDKLSDKLEPMVDQYIAPRLEKIAASEGAEAAKAAAQKIASNVASWGGSWLTRASSDAAFKTAATAFAEGVGDALEAFAGPIAASLQVAQLEIDLATTMYSIGHSALSHLFSVGLFGASIDELEAELHSKPTSTAAQCKAFFQWAFFTLMRNVPQEQAKWWAQVYEALSSSLGAGLHLDAFASDPVGTLGQLPIDLQTLAAYRITTTTDAFLASEYKAVFGSDP